MICIKLTTRSLLRCAGLLVFLFFISQHFVFASNECKPRKTAIEYKEVPNTRGVIYVDGELAEFDPCNDSVSYYSPRAENGPIFIVVHGGGGLTQDVKNAIQALRRNGYGVLAFDAFSMNDRWKGWQYWAYRVNNESRQRMLYKVTLGANGWLLNFKKVDPQKIFFYGISNGAVVVSNLAADQRIKAKYFFSEGMPGIGIGLPDKLIHPLMLIYGTRDNYAGLWESEWIWIRQDYCILNTDKFDGPTGNAKECSKAVNLSSLTEQPIRWFNRMKEEGQSIEIAWLHGAGHSIFAGELKEEKISFGNGHSLRFATSGGGQDSIDTLLRIISSKIE